MLIPAQPSEPESASQVRRLGSDDYSRPKRFLAVPLKRWPVPHQLPSQPFYGRRADLAALYTEYARQVGSLPFWLDILRSGIIRCAEFAGLAFIFRMEWRRSTPIFLIHGMPGVGKTSLAQTFAHSIAGRYKDGQLYANMEIGRERRSPADVLQDFLKSMGISENDLPEETAERAMLFRSMTAKRRVLVLLDAARGYDHIRHLLPSGDQCAVIITSKWTLGSELGAFEYVLNPPGTNATQPKLIMLRVWGCGG